MNILTSHPQWTTVVYICQKLSESGYKTVIAGGAVRDALRGVGPKDIDIATSASPEMVLSLFNESKYVGEHFGVVLVDGNIEVASFREEGEYKDGRHPQFVKLSTIEEDAKRRDFTINAMYYDPLKDQLIDLVNGKTDLNKGLIKTVGEPKKRFQEDHLRILRAYRFQAKTGFYFEDQTLKAIHGSFKSIQKISKERIQQEFYHLLGEKYYFTALSSMSESGVLNYVLPLKFQLNSFSFYFALNNNCREETRLAVLLYKDNSCDEVALLLRNLKFSNQFIKTTLQQIRALNTFFTPNNSTEDQLKVLSGELGEEIESILLIYSNWYESKIFESVILRFSQLADSNRVLPKAIIDGKFLIEHGFSPSPEFEELIGEGYKLQLQGVIRDKKDAKLWLSSNFS